LLFVLVVVCVPIIVQAGIVGLALALLALLRLLSGTPALISGRGASDTALLGGMLLLDVVFFWFKYSLSTQRGGRQGARTIRLVLRVLVLDARSAQRLGHCSGGGSAFFKGFSCLRQRSAPKFVKILHD